MSNGAKKETTLSACFPGLVDICETEDGQLLYLIHKNGQFTLQESAIINGREVIPPDRDAFPFTLPHAEKVMACLDDDDPQLYHDVVSNLKRFSALDDHQWAVAIHFLFLTYLHDHPDIYYAPILLFHAVPERGKSRTGKSLTYLAYRGIHLSELREANILRYCEDIHSTLFFDIMDVWKKATRTSSEDLLLGRFEKGQKSSRVLYPDKGAFKDMKHYDLYGPTIIASNEPLHKILDTRCLQITMPNVPGNYENPHPATALDLKARLTAWRARHLFSPLPAMDAIPGISGRLWDISKSLFMVNQLLDADSGILKEAILSISSERGEAKLESTEGKLVAIIKEITDEHGLDRFAEWYIKTNDILKKLNNDMPDDKQYSSQWVGKKLKSMSIHHRTVNGRSEIQLTAREYAVLLEQYGLARRESPLATETLPPETGQNSALTGVVGISRVSEQSPEKSYTFNSPEERQLYYVKMEELKQKGGISRSEMERLAQEAVLQRRHDNDMPF